MTYTTTELIADVKRNNTLASSTFRFKDADLLAIADQEISGVVVPTILSLQADRLLYTDYYPIVAGTQAYSLPYRAASQIKDIITQDTLTNPSIKCNLVQLNFSQGFNNVLTGEPVSFYFNDQQIMLVPVPNAASWLAISYPMRHSKLVVTDDVAIVSSVDYNTGIVTCLSVPAAWTTSSLYDVVIGNPQANPRLAKYDLVASAITSSTLTFTASALPTGLTAGDRICLANQSDILMLPAECRNYVQAAISCTVLEAQKDLPAFQLKESRMKEARSFMETALTPRITGEPKTVNVERSLLRRGRRYSIGIKA